MKSLVLQSLWGSGAAAASRGQLRGGRCYRCLPGAWRRGDVRSAGWPALHSSQPWLGRVSIETQVSCLRIAPPMGSQPRFATAAGAPSAPADRSDLVFLSMIGVAEPWNRSVIRNHRAGHP